MGERRRQSGRCVWTAVLLALPAAGCAPARDRGSEHRLPFASAGRLPAAIGWSSVSEPSCPADMLLVEGTYCPRARHVCKRWLDPPGRYHEFRCAKYERPARCAGARTPMRFCIDVHEYTEPGELLPANHQSLTTAIRTCDALGKRICREREWVFACEGEQMSPYPYGFVRDEKACNADRVDLFDREGKLRDLRVVADAFPRCTSPFGVRHQAGNLEELVAIDGSEPARPALKGAYWQPSRNSCRAAQTAHDVFYQGIETGFRCCSDPHE